MTACGGSTRLAGRLTVAFKEIVSPYVLGLFDDSTTVGGVVSTTICCVVGVEELPAAS